MLGFYLVSAEKRDLVRHFPDGRVAFEAVLVSEPVVRGKVIQCELMAMPQGKKPFRLRASILRDTIHRRYERLHFGDGIRVFSRISQPETVQRLSSQGNFDFRRWLQVRGVVGQTFVSHTGWTKTQVSLQPLSLAERAKIRLMRFRQKGVEALHKAGLNEEELVVVSAMVLGDKSSLTKELRETYSVSGASHVLALSGLHLGIIYMLMMPLTIQQQKFSKLQAKMSPELQAIQKKYKGKRMKDGLPALRRICRADMTCRHLPAVYSPIRSQWHLHVWNS